MRLASLENLEGLAVPSGYQIRTYQKGDAQSWVEIIKSSFGANYNVKLDEILYSQEFDPKSLFFATYQDQPVGTVYAWLLFSEGHKVGYIHMLSVLPEHQGKKIGRLLILWALYYFKNRNVQEVIVDTDDIRLPAIRLYLDLGFEPVYLEQSHKRRWKTIFEKLDK